MCYQRLWRDGVQIMKSLILILAFFSASAFAQDKQDGNQLLNELTSESHFSRGYSRGYIIGVANVIEDALCMSNSVTNRQVFDVVKIYLEQNPATRHEHQLVLVTRALVNGFPCKIEQTSKPKMPV